MFLNFTKMYPMCWGKKIFPSIGSHSCPHTPSVLESMDFYFWIHLARFNISKMLVHDGKKILTSKYIHSNDVAGPDRHFAYNSNFSS
jgi:hypothetical protein